MKTKDTVESAVKTEVASFQLQLPTMLDIKPFAEVALSATKTALIYELPSKTVDGSITAGYQVYVIKNKTRTSDQTSYYRPMVFTHKHEIRQWLIDASAQYNVKRKTRKTVMVEEAAEDDDE